MAYTNSVPRRRTTPPASKKRTSSALSKKERLRLTQLGICVVLFLTLFLGKGVFPHRLATVQQQLSAVLTDNTDFRGAFSTLGEALSRQDNLLGQVGQFCVEVFGPSPAQQQLAALELAMSQERSFLCQDTPLPQLAAHWLTGAPELWRNPTSTNTPAPEENPAPAASALPVGEVVQAVSYTGTPLPEGICLDVLSLGDLDTVTPVLGVVTSPFAYRDHPISGTFSFHKGLDIAADQGSPIAAFADGTVDYIGESDDFGLYLQIDHGNGIQSFYAHCDQLLVSKGDPVSAGETVALVGSTGVSTGPHLHLEIKCGGLRLNPAHYVDTRTSP